MNHSQQRRSQGPWKTCCSTCLLLVLPQEDGVPDDEDTLRERRLQNVKALLSNE